MISILAFSTIAGILLFAWVQRRSEQRADLFARYSRYASNVGRDHAVPFEQWCYRPDYDRLFRGWLR